MKYVEGVKQHLAIREDEIRVIIASTEWAELLVPFSRFLKETTIQVRGLKLSVTSEVIEVETVSPMPVEQGRIIASWHEARFYETREDLLLGITDIERRYEANRIENYVSLVLYSSNAQSSQHQENVHAVLVHFQHLRDGAQSAATVESPVLPHYQYCLYVASQLLSQEKYWELLKLNPDAYDVAREEGEGMEGEELLQYLHDSVSDMGSDVFDAYFEIGYAAKLKCRLLEDEGWQVWGTLRYGTFERNLLLSDETILAELCGSEGHTGQSFSRSFTVSNKSQVAGVREGISRCLEHNQLWAQALQLALNEVEEEYPDSTAEIHIFNPSTGLLTIYYALTREEGHRYLPGYRIHVKRGDLTLRAYSGTLVGANASKCLAELLQIFYQGSTAGLMLSFSWGGYTSEDPKILADCGFTYASFKKDFRSDPLQLLQLNGRNWERVSNFNPLEAFFNSLNLNRQLVDDLLREIGSKDHGGIFEF